MRGTRGGYAVFCAIGVAVVAASVEFGSLAMLVLGARLTDGLTTSCLKALRAWPVDLPCRLAL